MSENLKIKISVDSKSAATNVDELGSKFDKLKQKIDLGAHLSQLSAGLVGLAGGIGSVVGQSLSLADEFKSMSARLNLVSADTDEFSSNLNALFTSSQNASTSLSETTNLFISLRSATENLAVSQRDVLAVTDTINKTLTISGASSQASAAALTQLGQAFASGVLRGEELNSVLEQAPRLARAIADGIGVSVGALRELGATGQITSEILMNALLSQSEAINKEFETIPTTIENARTKISNSILMLVGDFDRTADASSGVANSLTLISDWIDTNRGNIVEFGSDVYKSFQLIGSSLILVVNGVREGVVSAVLIVSDSINSITEFAADAINFLLEKIEGAINSINSLVGGDGISIGRVDGELIDTSGLKAEYEKVKKENNEIFESIKFQFNDIAKTSYEARKAEVSDVKNTVKAINKEVEQIKPIKTKSSGRSSKAVDPVVEHRKALDKAIAYYDAIGDMENKRAKEKEKETLRLKELGLNNFQIQEYFAREELKLTEEKNIKKLEYEERYYELLGDKVRASNKRLDINAIRMKQDGYSNEEIANSLYGKERSRQNYENLYSSMGYDMGLAGTFQNRLNAIDEFNRMELDRINAHYATLELTQANHNQKQIELDRLTMQTRMATAGVGFDALGNLAKMFYDASDGENKTALRAYQAMMVGKAIVNTYTAASNAYATAGNPIVGAALAAVAIAQGMAQVAQIKAQKFHSGGYVGSNLAKDEVPAILQTGEYVLSRKQVSELKDGGTNTNGGGGANVTIVNAFDIDEAIDNHLKSRGGREVILNIVNGSR